MQTFTSSELVARIMAGERAAEEELVRRYSRGISTILRLTTDNRCLSEDLAQDTFAIAIQKLRQGELREPERLSGFICSIARNLALADLRKVRRERYDEAALKDLPAAGAQSQLDHVLLKEQAQIVRRALAELPTARDREILYRFYILEEDKDVICNDLRLDPLHFNRVLHRARQRYKDLYQKQNTEREQPD